MHSGAQQIPLLAVSVFFGETQREELQPSWKSSRFNRDAIKDWGERLSTRVYTHLLVKSPRLHNIVEVVHQITYTQHLIIISNHMVEVFKCYFTCTLTFTVKWGLKLPTAVFTTVPHQISVSNTIDSVACRDVCVYADAILNLLKQFYYRSLLNSD